MSSEPMQEIATDHLQNLNTNGEYESAYNISINTLGNILHEHKHKRMTRMKAERLVRKACRLPVRNGNTDNNVGMVQKCINKQNHGNNSIEQYYLNSGLTTYLDELIKRLQIDQPDIPQQYIADFFKNVAIGRNIEDHSYDYIQSTIQNRLNFLVYLQSTFSDVDGRLVITPEDFAELIWHRYPSFSVDIVLQSCFHLQPNTFGERKTSLHSMLKALNACFFYNEFLKHAADVFAEAKMLKEGRVIFPQTSKRSDGIANALTADRLVARLRFAAERNTYSIPPMEEVEKFVFKSFSFNEFCGYFYESHIIQHSIFELYSAFQRLSEDLHPPY